MKNTATILNKLIEIILDDLAEDEKIIEAIDSFNELHNSRLKYGYSDITNAVLGNYENKGFTELKYALNQIDENLMVMDRYLSEEYINENIDKNIIKDRLYTLKEHLNSLLVWLEYSTKKEISAIQKYEELNARYDTLSDKFIELDKKNKELNSDLSRQKTQNITILGIFSAIVTTFVAGVGIADRSLSDIADASPARLGFIALLLSFIFMNLLNFLYDFISKVSGVTSSKKEKHSYRLKYLNIWLIIMIVCLGLISYFDLHIINKITF